MPSLRVGEAIKEQGGDAVLYDDELTDQQEEVRLQNGSASLSPCKSLRVSSITGPN